MQQTSPSTNGATIADYALGQAATGRIAGSGPAVWLAGDPEDLKPWMERGAAGIVHRVPFVEEDGVPLVCKLCLQQLLLMPPARSIGCR